MHRLGNIFSTNKIYFVGYIIILVLGLLPQLVLDKNELFLKINNLNSSGLDSFFYWITYLGDGLVFVALILLVSFLSFTKAMLGLATFLGTGLIAQVLKQVFFSESYRPFKVIGGQGSLHIPPGVTPLINNSFPSGHTVTVFAMATFIILVYSLRKYSLLILIVAMLVAYSRIYLTHHFPVDVWAGSIIGVSGALLIYWFLEPILDKRLGGKSFLIK